MRLYAWIWKKAMSKTRARVPRASVSNWGGWRTSTSSFTCTCLKRDCEREGARARERQTRGATERLAAASTSSRETVVIPTLRASLRGASPSLFLARPECLALSRLPSSAHVSEHMYNCACAHAFAYNTLFLNYDVQLNWHLIPSLYSYNNV